MRPDLEQFLIKAGKAKPGDVIGLSDSEISSIERTMSLELPEIYKNFLRICGRKAGELFEDVDSFYPVILELREELEEILEEIGSSFTLPDDAFVFSGYQGYQYLYFICGEPDPKVWILNDGGGPPKIHSKSLSEHFARAVQPGREKLYQ